jgi:hypothetical protein
MNADRKLPVRPGAAESTLRAAEYLVQQNDPKRLRDWLAKHSTAAFDSLISGLLSEKHRLHRGEFVLAAFAQVWLMDFIPIPDANSGGVLLRVVSLCQKRMSPFFDLFWFPWAPSSAVAVSRTLVFSSI